MKKWPELLSTRLVDFPDHGGKKKDNRRTRRVLLLDSYSLLADGLASLLSREANVKVASLANADETAFRQEVTQALPDVILLTEASHLSALQVLGLLKDLVPQALVQVMTVHLDTNTIEVYETQKVSIRTGDTLLDLIWHGASGP